MTGSSPAGSRTTTMLSSRPSGASTPRTWWKGVEDCRFLGFCGGIPADIPGVPVRCFVAGGPAADEFAGLLRDGGAVARGE
eukprot:4358384-Lingulodinium_polyedra.AAC.1